MDDKVLIVIVSALIGVAGTYVVAILKHRKDLEFKYDTDLREKRITAYLELWKLLQDLAQYSRPRQLTYDDLPNIAASLRQWYFEKGGLFLSEGSRKAYEELQRAIQNVIGGNTRASQSALDEPTYQMLRQPGSALRTQLTIDVGTRKKSRLD